MATLALKSAKYSQRQGRAELLADLIKKKTPLIAVKGGHVTIDEVTINGEPVGISATSKIIDALNKELDLGLWSNKKLVALSALDKKNIMGAGGSKGFNAGDVAEGVFAAGLAARFLHKDDDIKIPDIVKVLKDLSGKRSGKTSSIVMESKNANPKVIDDVKLVVNLAEVNLDALFAPGLETMASMKPVYSAVVDFCNGKEVKRHSHMFYENNIANDIVIVSDGIGNQKGTKMDVSVQVTDNSNKLNVYNLNVSLKAGDVKQFGQVGGSGFDKQMLLWNMFDINVKSLESEYNLRLAKSGQSAIEYSYDYAAKQFNNKSDGDKATTLKSAIVKNMIGEEDIILVQLNKTAATYDPRLLEFNGKELSAKLNTTKANPEIKFYHGTQEILTVRAKVENGTYFRNYIEKGKYLHDYQKHG